MTTALLSLWTEWIVRSSLQVAVLAGLLLAAQPLLKRLPASIRHGLWLLVPIKALLPPALSAPWSLSAIAVAPAEGYMLGVLRLFADPVRGLHGATGVGSDIGVLATTELPVFGFGTRISLSVFFGVLFAIWALGVARLVWVLARQEFELAAMLASGRRVDSGPLAEALRRSAAELGLAKTPGLVLANCGGSPFLCGLLRPMIVLPAEMPGQLDAEELRAVLRHELEHGRRGDLVWTWVENVALTLFWFNPLLWVVRDRIAEERELAVDAAVSGASVAERFAYARTILKVLDEALPTLTAQNRTAFLGNSTPAARLERRLREAVAPVTVAPRWQGAIRGLAVAFAMAVLPMQSTSDEVLSPDRAGPMPAMVRIT